MVQIIPRWEWRMFAKQIEIQIDLGSFEQTRHVESSEVYLVSAASRANPKIRDGKMDIKTLESVNEYGLEQWKPDMKAQFPLLRDQVTLVLGALDLANPDLDREAYDLEALLALVDGEGRGTSVRVDKVRDQYDVKGCTVEMSDVTFDGDRYKTVAAENSSETLVWETVKLLGLQEHKNTNYVTFIKEIRGLG